MDDLGSIPPEPIQILEVAYSDKFEFHLMVPQRAYETFTSRASSTSLKNLASTLRTSIAAECRRSSRDYLDIPIADRDGYMRTVIEVGSDLFRKMVPGADDRDKLRRILSANAGQTIRVTAGGVCIPWEALCLAENPDTATYQNFLGWNHIIARTVEFPYGRDAEPETVSATHVGLVEDENLASVKTRKTRNAAANLGSGIVTLPLRPLVSASDRDHFYSFFEDQSPPKQVVQFDCHIGNAETIQSSHMRVTQQFQIPFRVFGDLELPDEPFIFMNACSSGSVSWEDTDGYAGTLHAAGAVLVVAAEADLGDAFMADFAGSFYLASHESATVVEALLKAKRIALGVHRNPSALFYSIYGDTRYRLGLAPLGDERKTELDKVGKLVADVWPPQRGPDPDFRGRKRPGASQAGGVEP
jgi:hypothetical protein